MLPPEVLVPLIYGPVLVFVFCAVQATRRRRLRAWRDTARHLGLDLVSRGRFLSDPSLSGRIDGLPLEIDVVGGRYARTRFRVKDLARGLSLRPESIGSGLKKLVTGEDIQIGDGPFDDAVLVEGDPTLAHALLGDKARRVATDALASGAALEDGTLSLSKPGVMLDPDRLGATTRSLLAFAHHLRPRQDLVAALRANAEHDPVSGVRQACLKVLRESHPRSPHTRAACEHGLHDKAAAVRLQAAAGLGEEGNPTLVELARDEALPTPLRVEAVTRLRQMKAIAGVLPALIESEASEIRRAGIAAAIEARTSHLLAAIQRRIGPAEPEERADIAWALGELGSGESTGTLLRLLALPETVVRVAAARALGKVGELAAVTPLKEIAEGGLLSSGELRSAATDAIKSIQARQAGAEAGQLALTGGDEAGALSLSQREAGALSIAPGFKRPQ